MSIFQQINNENEGKKDKYLTTAIEMLSELIYSDSTHFIFELLQNAEDAIRHRSQHWEGSRTIEFCLSDDQLRISHFGLPFNEKDVQAICSVGESTKDDLTDIGRFGMGFKSVYKYTKRPAIHSGSGEVTFDFAINNYISPETISPIKRDTEETVFLFPLKSDEEETSYNEIADGLCEFALRNLLFLREINTAQWTVEGWLSGFYRRESDKLNDFTRHVQLSEERDDGYQDNEEWLVFSRPVFSHNNHDHAGDVEIAFKVDPDINTIRTIDQSPLIVYFATNEGTGLKFLIQGPYQTILNRESTPSTKWNKHLVDETFSLIRDALCWMRDEGKLDINILNCLPFAQIDGSRFKCLFPYIKELLHSESLLPTVRNTYISADDALLTRSQGVRDLLSIEQISILYDISKPAWLDSDITQGRRTRDLYEYLVHELKVLHITPEGLLRQIDRTFLENQTDGWIINFYIFLNERRGLRFESLPIIRRQDGKHITFKEEIFLPSSEQDRTDFPIVHRNVLNEKTREFLRYLGLKPPDLVDDVVKNILPEYQNDCLKIENIITSEYENDLERIIRAYNTTNSWVQRKKLIKELKQTKFVASSGATAKTFSRPKDVYFKTRQLGKLLAEVGSVKFIDNNTYSKLSESTMHIILEKCGARNHLEPLEIEMSQQKIKQLKDQRQKSLEKQGQHYATNNPKFIDYDLRYLKDIISNLRSPALEYEQRKELSKLLWEELIDIRREHPNIFTAKYTWTRHRDSYREETEALFIELLNQRAWVPHDGILKTPGDISFDDLSWEKDSFLLSMIKFKTPEIEQAMQEAGVKHNWLPAIRQLEKEGKTPEDFLRQEQANRSSDQHREPDNESSYADKIGEAMTFDPPDGPNEPVELSVEGSETSISADRDTKRAAESGRLGSRRKKVSYPMTHARVSKEMSKEFESMLRLDYNKRCQICGSSFRTKKGNNLHTFTSHTVKPMEHLLTNHFGNLLSLCGWHFALISYGQWELLHPVTDKEIDTNRLTEELRDIFTFLKDMEREEVLVTIRFSNLYLNWSSEPERKDQKIRFSKPHIKYFYDLLQAESDSSTAIRT